MLLSLPDELLAHIFSFLQPSDLESIPLLCKHTHQIFTSDWPWKLAFHRYFNADGPIIKTGSNWREEYTKRLYFWSNLKQQWSRSKFINHRTTFAYDALMVSKDLNPTNERNYLYLHQVERAAILQCCFHKQKLIQITRLQAFSGLQPATCIASYIPPSNFFLLHETLPKSKNKNHHPHHYYSKPTNTTTTLNNTSLPSSRTLHHEQEYLSNIPSEIHHDGSDVHQLRNEPEDHQMRLLRSTKFAFGSTGQVDVFVQRSFAPCKHPFRKWTVSLRSKHEQITHLSWVDDEPVVYFFCQASSVLGSIQLRPFRSPSVTVFQPRHPLTSPFTTILATVHALVFVPLSAMSMKVFHTSTQQYMDLPCTSTSVLTKWIYSTWSHPYLYQCQANEADIHRYNVMTLEPSPRFLCTAAPVVEVQLHPNAPWRCSESVLLYADVMGGIHVHHHPSLHKLAQFHTKEACPIVSVRVDPLYVLAINQLGCVYAFEPHGKEKHKWVHPIPPTPHPPLMAYATFKHLILVYPDGVFALLEPKSSYKSSRRPAKLTFGQSQKRSSSSYYHEIKEDYRTMIDLDQEEEDTSNHLFSKVNGNHDLTYEECMQIALSMSMLPPTSSSSEDTRCSNDKEEDSLLKTALALSLLEQ